MLFFVIILKMLHTPFYDPKKTYEENFNDGPFGAFAPTFADSEVGVPTQSGVGTGSGEPKYNFLGCKVNSLFGIPAGPLLNGKFINAALDLGFDIPMHKTVRTRPRPSNLWPNVLPVDVAGDLTLEKASQPLHTKDIFEEPLSITNSFGNPSYEPGVWQKDIRSAVAHAKPGQIVSASFEGTRWPGYSEEDYVDDWVLAAKLLKETGVHFIEANLSCPNEGITSLLCFDAAKVETITKAIKKEIGSLPLIIKISYFPDEKGLYDLVKRVGNIVDGFSAINTISAEVVDKNGQQALPGEGRLRSGICGASIKWAGLDMVRKLKKLREEFGYKYSIIGVGGVTTADDFFEYRNAGADAVMSATGAMWNPYLAKEIKEKLR